MEIQHSQSQSPTVRMAAPSKSIRSMQSSDSYQKKTFKCRRKVLDHRQNLCTYSPLHWSSINTTTTTTSSSILITSILLCLALFANQLTTVSSALLLSNSDSSSSPSSSSSMWNTQDGSSSSSSDDQQLKLTFTVSEGVPVSTFIGIIKSSNASLQVEPPFLIVPVPGGLLQSQPASPVISSSSSKSSQQSLHHHKSSHHHHHPHHQNNLPSAAVQQSGTVDTDLNIDQSTGEIRTAVELDREQRSHYSFIAISLTGINIHVKIVSDSAFL